MKGTIRTLPIRRRPDNTYEIESRVEGVDTMEPYTTKAEAERDRRGVERFLEKSDKGQNPFE